MVTQYEQIICDPHNPKNVCPLCPEIMLNKDPEYIKNHWAQAHSELQKQCPTCSDNLPDIEALQAHHTLTEHLEKINHNTTLPWSIQDITVPTI